MDENLLRENISKLRLRVRLGAQKSQRETRDIVVLAVSKTRPAEDLRAAHALGLREFGESYVQEALEKMQQLEDLDLVWHFIGPIQSNKTRPIAAHFDWVHSVDRLKIARRLNDQRPEGLPPLQICLQVNVSGEASKSGIAEPELIPLAREVAALPRLQLRGLMAIPVATPDEAVQRQSFARLHALLRQLIEETGMELDTLSMGMSGDLEAAIAEGTTIIRVGSAIFGPRGR